MSLTTILDGKIMSVDKSRAQPRTCWLFPPRNHLSNEWWNRGATKFSTDLLPQHLFSCIPYWFPQINPSFPYHSTILQQNHFAFLPPLSIFDMGYVCSFGVRVVRIAGIWLLFQSVILLTQVTASSTTWWDSWWSNPAQTGIQTTTFPLAIRQEDDSNVDPTRNFSDGEISKRWGTFFSYALYIIVFWGLYVL